MSMSRATDLVAESRRRADELMNTTKQKETERLAAREKERQADAAKTARLKELRLAKEAADAATAKSAKNAKKAAAKKAAEPAVEAKRHRQV